MCPRALHPPPLKARSVRSDGAQTRGQILQIAGGIFADQGFERTTSRQVCAAAGINLAAVNYHFGSRDGLYDAVLMEAHGQLVRLDDLESIRRSGAEPQAQLRALISLLVGRPSGQTLPWGLRVLSRELMAPSSHVGTLIRRAVLPKVRVMLALIGAVMGLPPEHRAVQRALALVILPCIMLAIAPRDVLHRTLPGVTGDAEALIEDMVSHASAGLASIARRYAAPPSGEPGR